MPPQSGYFLCSFLLCGYSCRVRSIRASNPMKGKSFLVGECPRNPVEMGEGSLRGAGYLRRPRSGTTFWIAVGGRGFGDVSSPIPGRPPSALVERTGWPWGRRMVSRTWGRRGSP